MGSFNTTCFASRQTIAPRDECYVLPVIQARGYRPVDVEFRGEKHAFYGVACTSCYPAALWTPYGGFIEAVYDDYGQVVPKDTEINRIRLLHFIRSLLAAPVKVSQGENTVHDVPFDLAEFVSTRPALVPYVANGSRFDAIIPADATIFDELVTVWDYIWERAQEYRLFAADWDNIVRPVQFSVLHASSMNALIAEVPDKNYRKEPLDPRTFFTRAVESASELANNEIFFKFALENKLRYLGYFSGMSYPSEAEELDIYANLFWEKRLSLDEFFGKMKPALDARYAISGLNELNLRFFPMEYAGQDYSNEIGSRVANFVMNVSRSVTASRAYDEDEDEE